MWPIRIVYCRDEDLVLEAVDDALDALIRDGVSDIVILTCKTEAESLLAQHLEKGMYPAGKKRIRFTTCRKFKGLEADAVILVDIDEDTFLGNDGQNVLLYYVGASRARLWLDMVTTIDQEGCMRVLEGMGKEKPGKKPFKTLASKLNALPVLV